MSRKRPREDELPATAQPPDDDVRWGPSGGGNRESQGRRNVFQRPAFMQASPYSRSFVQGWSNAAADSLKTQTSLDTDVLYELYIKAGCPKTLFRGCCFFLNSCDYDPTVSTFMLEKIIRELGGSTCMGPSGATHIIAQHLCSTKSMKVSHVTAARYVLPQYILECASRGMRLPESEFESPSKRGGHMITIIE